MSKKIKVPKATTGRGYVGVWRTPASHLGWWMPRHVPPNGVFIGSNDADAASERCRGGCLEGTRSFLCEITITPVLDKAGRPITKLHKG